MIKPFNLVVFIFIILIGVVGCASKKSITTYNDLISELKNKGYKVEEINSLKQDLEFSLFGVPAKYIKVEGVTLTIYEFESSDDASNKAKGISKTGNRINNAFINWVAPPHFYNSGNLIVCFCAFNNTFKKDFEEMLGKSLTD